MIITVTTLEDQMFNLDVNEDMELSDFKMLCEVESGINQQLIKLTCDGKDLSNCKTLKIAGVKNGDMIVLIKLTPAPTAASTIPTIDFGGIRVPNQPPPSSSQQNASTIPTIDFGSIRVPTQPPASSSLQQQRAASNQPRQQLTPALAQQLLTKLRNTPADVARLRQRNQPLAEAIQANDLDLFTRVLERQDREAAAKVEDNMRMINGNPFDPNIQNQIEEAIRLKNVDRNMETAMEFSPESFGTVVMLYINCIVNGHHIKAFVDSGAQMTIMSLACAKRCDLERLIDKRWEGIAKGVGVQRIIGRIHLCQMQIESDYLQSSFSVLEQQPMEMLLGLDMLRRHQCSIDLRTNTLNIGTTGTVTHFLPENELPKDGESVSDKDRETLGMQAQGASTSGSCKSPSMACKRPCSPGTQSSSSPQQQQQHSSPSNFAPVEADVQQLMSNGFQRDVCVQALKNSKGNLDEALVHLLSQ